MQWEPIKFMRIAGAKATLWRAIKPSDGNPYIYAATFDQEPVEEVDNYVKIQPRDTSAVLSQRAALDNLRHGSIPATRAAAAGLLATTRESEKRSGGRNGGRPSMPADCPRCGQGWPSKREARACCSAARLRAKNI